RWAANKEIKQMYRFVRFTPGKWRKQAAKKTQPTVQKGTSLLLKLRNLIRRKKGKPEIVIPEEPLPQGIVVGCTPKNEAIVDTGDVHALMLGAAGVGKTAYWLYPCLEYALASGMSLLSTDTKGDIMRNYGNICKDYGYNVAVIDLRNPTRSDGNNLLHLVNKYMDMSKAHPEIVAYRAKSEKYAKIIAKTIIMSGTDSAASYGQNAFFYDAAEGLITATILLVAEFAKPEERHIISVFKIIQELLAPSGVKGKTQFQLLMDKLPDTHKARWFAGAALNSPEQAMSSVMSTALSRLNTFLDSELEQLLCFDTALDAEKFCNEKSALFIIMPEENPNTFFLISLIIQQLYREILAVADENGGKLKNRCIFFCDEFGTLPKIDSAEMMFSASRSRRLQIVPIIQSFAQLEKNYGKEGAEIIIDNTQLTISGGFAPNSTSADQISKALGTKTVMSGTVSKGKDQSSQSLQMIERPLMTADELRNLPKGEFIVMKTGFHPMKVRMKLFFEWGIEFNSDDPYVIPEHGSREVRYASKADIEAAIDDKYGKEEETKPTEEANDRSLNKQKQTSAENIDSVMTLPDQKECMVNVHAPIDDKRFADLYEGFCEKAKQKQ
nr:type IV secretory system conjugative DNA transfer family protein [Saccharofermentans sp.]